MHTGLREDVADIQKGFGAYEGLQLIFACHQVKEGGREGLEGGGGGEGSEGVCA
jgi:hypothetical protein